MKFILIFITIFLSPIIFGQTSYIAPTKILNKKGYQLGISSDVFNTSKRIDKDGKAFALEDDEKFSRMRAEVMGYYGLTENLQVGAGVRFIRNSSTMLDPVTSETSTETSSGIQSTVVSLIYAFKPVDRIYYTLEGAFRYTPYINEETTGIKEGSLVLGDEGNELSAGFGMRYSTNANNSLMARVGYRKPGTELASEVYWQFEGAFVWRYLALVAGVNGVSSMNDDPYEDDPINKPNYYTGTTALYNGTNRAFIAPYVGINLALGNNWRVETQAFQVTSGRSTDLGTCFGVSIIRRIDSNKALSRDAKFKEYDFEGIITKISPKSGFVVIDKGITDDVQKGMKVDFFEFDYVGGNILLASGVVISSKVDTAIVKISQLFNPKRQLKEGVVARGSFR